MSTPLDGSLEEMQAYWDDVRENTNWQRCHACDGWVLWAGAHRDVCGECGKPGHVKDQS